MRDYSQDLEYLANNVTEALNIFSVNKLTEAQLIVAFTHQDYIAVIMQEQENADLASLRLLTRDMAASWRNVPQGFAQINESRGLFNDMKKAAHPSLKRNCLWYIGYQIKETLGDVLEVAEVASYRNFRYRVKFTNGYSCVIYLNKDFNEYTKPHRMAKLFSLYDDSGKQLTEMLTTDECMLTLSNMAMMKDKRAAKLVQFFVSIGGKSRITHSYRLPDESLDEIKAAFANKYMIQVQIKNKQFFVKVMGREHSKLPLYVMEEKEFATLDDICKYAQQLSQLSAFDSAKAENIIATT